MKSSLLIAILSTACAAQTPSLRVVPVHLDATGPIPKTIQFFCTQRYDRQACVKHSLALRDALAAYPLERLGTWSFVLVPADDWRALVRALRGNPVSPAFSIIDQRITVLESSLFTAPPIHNKTLLLTFGVTGSLELAVSHELGHAICQDKDERRADDYGRDLRDKKPVNCGDS